MITIYPPEIQSSDNTSKLSFPIIFDDERKNLWYTYPSEFEKFLVTENLDAALVGILFFALKSKSDIKLEGKVSARLLYALKSYLIPALCLRNKDFSEINIDAGILNHENLNETGVAGTGLSCGVDSFTTYYLHEKESKPFEIKYFTFLNAGSHGDFGGDKARRNFKDRFSGAKSFANQIDKKIIPVDSNLSELLLMNFQYTHTLRNLSCILNLQRLFKYYYYSSPHRLDYYNLRSNDTGDFDILILNMLSTESLDFFSSAAAYTRIERTKFISQFPLTYEYLDVCVSPNTNAKFLNCSKCDKCLRTQLTLDILKTLKNYERVFDISKYKENKDRYIGKVIARKGENRFDQELFNFLKETDSIRLKHYYYLGIYRGAKLKKKILKLIKN